MQEAQISLLKFGLLIEYKLIESDFDYLSFTHRMLIPYDF
jgi:hypothetical protein